MDISTVILTLAFNWIGFFLPGINIIKSPKQSLLLLSLLSVSYNTILLKPTVENLKSLVYTVLLSYLILLLAGCPFTVLHEESICLAIYCSSILFPIELRPRNVIIATLVGCWLGAFLLPLDWQQEYQKWPIPSAIGANLCNSLLIIFLQFDK